MSESESDLTASQREQQALRVSITVSAGFGVIALVWGLTANSQVILLDAIFEPLSLAMRWASIRVSRVVARGPTRRYQFGRAALIPIVVGVQALALAGGLLYASMEAVRVILDGGSEVAAAGLALYGAVSALTSIAVSLYLKRIGGGLGLVDAEAAGWLSGAVSSFAIVVGAGVVFILRGTALGAIEPYTDSVLVLVSAVLLANVPIRMLRQAVSEIQGPTADDQTEQLIHDAVERIRAAEGLPEPVVRTRKVGNEVYVEVSFVTEGEWTITGEDRVRRAVHDSLQALGDDIHGYADITHDADLVE